MLGLGDLGVFSMKSVFFFLWINILSIGSVGVEENVEEVEFIFLEMGDGDVEIVEDVL